jgi:hypothetical protein
VEVGRYKARQPAVRREGRIALPSPILFPMCRSPSARGGAPGVEKAGLSLKHRLAFLDRFPRRGICLIVVGSTLSGFFFKEITKSASLPASSVPLLFSSFS